MIVGLMFLPSPLGNWLSFSVYTYACITDFFDGYLARAWHQQSAFGRFLDPIADKLLIAGVLLALVGIDRFQGISVLPAAVILCREIVVSGLREFLAEASFSIGFLHNMVPGRMSLNYFMCTGEDPADYQYMESKVT